MLGALISFLLVYAIYAFIDWLRNSKASCKPYVTPHKRIARSIWIYCIFLIAVAITMVCFTDFSRERFYRPMYGQYKGWYFPNGRYSDLRIGNIRDKEEVDDNWNTIHTPILMGHNWEELPYEEPDSPYKRILSTFHTYNYDKASELYGRGIVLRVYDLDEEIENSHGREKSVYKGIINSFVNDSSFYRISNNFAPYSAIETRTYGRISTVDDTPIVFQKHITIFANNRAYELNFYVDQHVDRPSDTNTFDYLDAEFLKTAKELDLNSYEEWKEQESQYLNNLKTKCAIFIGLYLLCIVGAISFAYRYYRNIGNINPKAAKITNVLSLVNFITFALLGLGFIAAFCSIHYEYIEEMYQYRFSAYIDDEYAATSVLCYGAYFLLLIIPTNRFYIRSYTQPKQKKLKPKAKHGILYWLVRPVVLISKLFSKSTKAIRDEYNKQISEKN
ncbi:MAG: hypothetical protein HDS21_02640 [Bacteroides sp.]|nr:hypothetical protein [Bacteroides sp.]